MSKVMSATLQPLDVLTSIIRVAAYIRWSDPDQGNGLSHDVQLRIIKEDLARRGWHLVEVYIDDGRSGRSLRKREAFRRMVADAEAGKFDVVVVAQLDRFARNIRDALEQLDILENNHGVQVRSVKENIDPTLPSAPLIRTILFAVAETFSRNLSVEVRRAQFEMFTKGRHIGGVPFGYTLQNSHTRESKLALGPEAPLVRTAFEMYATGDHSMADIALTLNGLLPEQRNSALASDTSAGKCRQVTRDTIRYMLTNNAYRGIITYGDAETSDPSLVIIGDDLFDLVQRRLETNGKRPVRPRQKKVGYLLTGTLFCGLCGGKLDGVSTSAKRRYYRGRYYRDRNRAVRQACTRPSVRAGDLDARVARDLARIGRLVPHDAMEQVRTSLDSTEAAVLARQTIKTLRDDIERLTHVFRKGNIGTDAYDAAERDLKQQIARCEDLLNLSLESTFERVIAALRDFPVAIPYHNLDALGALNTRVRDLFVSIEVGEHTQPSYEWTSETLLLFDFFGIDPNAALPPPKKMVMLPIDQAISLYIQRPLPHMPESGPSVDGRMPLRRRTMHMPRPDSRPPCGAQRPLFDEDA